MIQGSMCTFLQYLLSDIKLLSIVLISKNNSSLSSAEKGKNHPLQIE